MKVSGYGTESVDGMCVCVCVCVCVCECGCGSKGEEVIRWGQGRDLCLISFFTIIKSTLCLESDFFHVDKGT